MRMGRLVKWRWSWWKQRRRDKREMDRQTEKCRVGLGLSLWFFSHCCLSVYLSVCVDNHWTHCASMLRIRWLLKRSSASFLDRQHVISIHLLSILSTIPYSWPSIQWYPAIPFLSPVLSSSTLFHPPSTHPLHLIFSSTHHQWIPLNKHSPISSYLFIRKVFSL